MASLDTPEAALIQARAELIAGRVPSALAALDRLIYLVPTGTDEAFMLYARALEKAGPQKDIKRAFAYYKKVRDEYPESAFWDEAAARAAYIERHYFDIR
jgi:outer membrane protein assembly factor BamD (BamD/ComL family)